MLDGVGFFVIRHPGLPQGRLNHRIMFMLDRGKFCSHGEKPDQDDQALRIKSVKSENDQIKDQAYGHGQRAAEDQLMPLRLCHGYLLMPSQFPILSIY